MLKTLKSQKGFTIVELLIVIVVIGILAALVLNTFSGVQRRARDTQRQNSVVALSTQLEAYYTDRGGYPAVADLQDATWVANNLKGFDAKALKTPGEQNADSLSGSTSGSKDDFGYVTSPSPCVSPTTNANPPVATSSATPVCASFTLSWFSEDKNVVNSKASLNN